MILLTHLFFCGVTFYYNACGNLCGIYRQIFLVFLKGSRQTRAAVLALSDACTHGHLAITDRGKEVERLAT
jgi:hypothetical protein